MKFAGLFLALALLLTAACGGDDSGAPSVDVTPVGTKDPTPTPGPVSSGDGVPTPVEPQIDEELEEVARDEFEGIPIEPGSAYEIGTQGLVETGACDNFQFDFSWQIIDPYPPRGASIVWQFDNGDQEFEVASGANGNQSVGCGQLRGENVGKETVVIAMRWASGVRR